MTEKEMIAFVLRPDLLELRAPAGREWVLKFCNSLLARLDSDAATLTPRQRHTLHKCYTEAAYTAHWVDACRTAPDPLAHFRAVAESRAANGIAFAPHVQYAIRRGLGASDVEALA